MIEDFPVLQMPASRGTPPEILEQYACLGLPGALPAEGAFTLQLLLLQIIT